MTSIDEPDRPSSDLRAVPVAASATGRNATRAVLALVLGAASLLLLLPAALPALLAAVAAVILGHLAVREVRVTGERGRPVAIAGLITGYLTVGLGAVLLLMAVAAGAAVTDSHPAGPDACRNTTGDFSQKQLQACFDQTNPG